MPTFGSLFAGIGGIDLGLERAGWECRFQVEWSDWCQHNLAHHWPDVPRYGDIADVNWSAVERVDLLAGGFPCQPFSYAGQRQGTADERWLWPEFARAIRALRPRLVLVENVPGLLAGHGGMGAVLGDLAELGYDAEWDSLPAAAFGAPHLRYRVWIVAYPNGRSDDRGGPVAGDGRSVPPQGEFRVIRGGDSREGDLQDADGGTVESRRRRRRASEAGIAAANADPFGRDWRAGFLGARGRGQPSDSGWWAVEPDVDRMAHGVPGRLDRLQALGNAVVPQTPEWIGRRLMDLTA